MKKNARDLILSYIFLFITGVPFLALFFKRISSGSVDPFYSNIYLSILGIAFLFAIYFYFKNVSVAIDKIFSFFDKEK